MKVLHLNTNAAGGSYECAVLLSSGLAKEGVDSRVLCKQPLPSKGARQLLNRLVRRISVSSSREPWHGTWRFLPPPDPAELKSLDIVHLHTVGDWFDVPQWLWSLPANIGVVASLHDLWHVSGGCFLYRGCERFADACRPCPILERPADRFLASRELARKSKAYRARSARLVANSRWLANIAEQSVTAKACGGLRVISPAIDTTVFKPLDKARCRAELDLPADAFLIATGCASLTDVNKNMPWLMQRLAQLPALKDTLVVAFGEGELPVPDGVKARLMGVIRDRRVLAKLLAAVDVFVSASQMETYGLTLVEAMACGTPVVAFQVGAIPEVAPHGRAGILCALQDGNAVVAALTRLRDRPQIRQGLGETASALALSRNDLRTFASSYAAVYQDCLATVARHRPQKPLVCAATGD